MTLARVLHLQTWAFVEGSLNFAGTGEVSRNGLIRRLLLVAFYLTGDC